MEAPRFARLEADYAITHYYFIDTDGVVLLRLHASDLKGDRITRASFEQAHESGSTVSGLDVGATGTFVLRVVRPVRSGDRIIGYLELGKAIDRIAKDVQEVLDVGIHIFIRDEFMTSSPDPSLDDPTAPPIFAGRQCITELAPGLPSWFSQAVSEHQSEQAETDPWNAANPLGDDSNRGIGVLPLTDASGVRVGEMVLVFDVEDDIGEMWHEIVSVGGALLGGGLAYLSWRACCLPAGSTARWR
jgi:hypothetical protein